MTKNLSTKIFTLLALSLILSIGQVFAQSTVTGGINGTVTDPQGGVVPNASITVTNIGTNSVVTVTTNEDGGYRVSNLQPGTYRVETTVTGFAPVKADNIIVEVGQSTPVDIPLSLGTATAEVEVTAEAPVINTTSPELSSNINQTSINELPINGRRASNFVLLTPATVPDGTFGLISFRGISGLLNNSTVDGGDNNQAFQSEERGRTRIGYVVSQSAIREFQVNTSNYSAEYGRSAGGVVNSVTKSGTNGFHGDLFEYYRNNKFGARNPLAFQTILNPDNTTTQIGIKPKDVRHQFGGTIGGPIVKDRLFFFFSYDQQKRDFPGLSVFGPNLNYLNSADTVCLTGTLGVVITRPGLPNCTGKGLTLTQINSVRTFIGSLSGETPRRQDQTLFLPKIDWQINQNNLFTVSYNRLRAESPAGLQTQATNTLGRRSFGDDFVDVDNLNIRLQSTITPNLLNEARFQYSQDHEYAFSQEPLPGEPLTATTVAGPRTPSIALTGGISFGTTANFERVKFPFEDRIQIADSVTWTKGRHTVKFGGDFNRVTDDIQNLRSEAGSYLYSTINDFIIDYLNWQSPLPATTNCYNTVANRVGRCYNGTYLQGVGIPGLKFSTAEYNFFVQDDFRLSPRITVNLGLRYEYQKLPDAVLPNASTAIIPGDLRTLNEATSTLPSDKNNFGPRLGVAIDLTGDGKTTLRAGYGIYYGRIINAQIYNSLLNTGNPGGQGQFTVNANFITNCFPLVPTATLPCAPVFPNVLPTSLTPASAAIQFFEKNFDAPLINQFDFIVERQIMRNTVVSVGYLGSLGRNLPTFVDQNLRPLGTVTNYTVVGGPNAGQVFGMEQYGRFSGGSAQTQIQSSSKSEYNALVFQFNRRFTDGLQVQSSYTWAKSTDTNQNSSPFPFANAPLNVADRSLDAGPSNNDVRHKFVASAVYAPTFYKGSEGSVQNYLFNGWSIAPIVTFYTGRPYSGNVQGTSLNATFGDQRFPLNSRNSFRLPNILNVDLRLSKRFNFTERYRLELLAEGFNIFNRTHVFIEENVEYIRQGTNLVYNQPFGNNTESSSSNYRERQIQFAVRFQY